MSSTLRMDSSGRSVLPKPLRERLNLRAGTRFRASGFADRLELAPIADGTDPAVKTKGGVTVLAATGKLADTAVAVAAERTAQAMRGCER